MCRSTCCGSGKRKFPHVKPLKRAGGRRYYRPEDLDLLRGIRSLLYSDGLTIKGAQKILREQGPRYVMELGRGATSARSLAARARDRDIDSPIRRNARPTFIRSGATRRVRDRHRARAFLRAARRAARPEIAPQSRPQRRRRPRERRCGLDRLASSPLREVLAQRAEGAFTIADLRRRKPKTIVRPPLQSGARRTPMAAGSERGAAWLAHQSGGLGVASSNLAAPTKSPKGKKVRARRSRLAGKH